MISALKVEIGVNAVDLQVYAIRHMLLLLVHKLLLVSLTNWCCSLSAVSSIKYALTVNPNIYVPYIKQFWNTVVVKQVNDITRLQALVDKKKVVVTEAAIREALHLDDAESVDCLPNEEIFTELARIGYKKPSTKLTFYKVFSSLWKFLIHTILQCTSAKRTSWNEFSPAMTFAVICLSTGKGFSGVETPLFEGMLVGQEVDEEGDADEHIEEVNAGDVAQGDDSVAHAEVVSLEKSNKNVIEPSIPSPTPLTPLPQPPQNVPSTSQVHQIPPQSPQVQPSSPQPQPQQAVDFPMSLFQEALDACAALTRRVENLEYYKGEMIAEMDKDDAVILIDEKEDDKKVEEVKVDGNAQVQGRQVASQAEIYKIDMDHASKVLSMQKDEPAEVQEVEEVVTTAKLIYEVTAAASDQVTAASTTIHAAAQVPAATLTAAPAKVAAAPSRRRK
nr:xylulose kinase-1 [Tanacetum cinerariifolium]